MSVFKNKQPSEAIERLKINESELISLIDELRHLAPLYPPELYEADLEIVRNMIIHLANQQQSE